MRRPLTIQLEDKVLHRLDSLSGAFGGCTRIGRSLNRWVAEYALPRFCLYEERRQRRQKARIDREVKEMKRRALEAVHVRALEEDEIREGLELLDKLQSRGEVLSAEEKGKAEEAMAALLARRKMNRLHARALEEDETREALKLADRLRKRGELSFEEEDQVKRILKG